MRCFRYGPINQSIAREMNVNKKLLKNVYHVETQILPPNP